MKNTRSARIMTIVLCSLSVMTALFFNSSMITNYTVVISEDLGISRTAFSLYSTIRALAAVAANLALPLLLRYGSAKLWIVMGLVGSSVNLMLFSLAHSLPAIYSLALLGGIASALCGIPPVTLILQSRFRRDFGTTISIAVASSGFGGMIFAPLLGRITAAASWRSGFRLMGVLCGVIALLTLICLHDAPTGSVSGHAKASRPRSSNGSIPLLGKTLPARNFRILLLISAAFSLGPVAICTNTASVLQDIGFSTLFATGTGYSIYAFANSSGKIFMGRISDRYGPGKMLLVWYAAVPLAMAYFMLCRTPQLLPILPGLLLAGLSAGIYGVPLPIICRALYQDAAEQVYAVSLCTSVTNLALAVSYLIIHSFYDRTGSYMGALTFSLVLSAVCLLAVLRLCIINRKVLFPLFPTEKKSAA